MITKAWNGFGRLNYWLSWPLVFLYIRRTRRTRVIITFEGQIVVVKGWLSNGKWNLPGGGRHTKESSLASAIREVREEVGLQLPAERFVSLGTSLARESKMHFDIDRFVVQLDHRPDLVAQMGEITEARWIATKELNESNANPDVLEALNAWSSTT